MKIVPIITCKPWNPVLKKKQDPYIPSLIVKVETKYSTDWSVVNIKAAITVNNAPNNPLFLSPFIKKWWLNVRVVPLVNKIIVLTNGNSKGSIESIPNAGYRPPNSKMGAMALCRKPQNIERKKDTSDITNNKKPKKIPLWTTDEWSPL